MYLSSKELLNLFSFLVEKCVTLHDSLICLNLVLILEWFMFNVFCVCPYGYFKKVFILSNKWNIHPWEHSQKNLSQFLFIHLERDWLFYFETNCFYMLLRSFLDWNFNNNNVSSVKLSFWQTCLLDRWFCWFSFTSTCACFFFVLNRKRVEISITEEV